MEWVRFLISSCRSNIMKIALLVGLILLVYCYYNCPRKSSFTSVNEQYHQHEQKEHLNANNVLSVSKSDSEKTIDLHKDTEFIDVFITFTNADGNHKFQEKFKTTVKSLFRFASVPVNLHILGDDKSEAIAKEMIVKNAGHAKYKITHLHVDDLAKQAHGIISNMQKHFSYKPGAYFSDALFFLSIVIHRVLPSHKKVIMLDADLKFNADIKELHRHFEEFTEDNIMGIAREMQPVYKHNFYMYRNKNKGTRVGGPPPDGLTGFNSGVLLLDLEKMRKSSEYNNLITEKSVTELTEKYMFKGNLGDQDFYTLILLEYEHLFHVLPCTWNRQLCQWWRNHGYGDVFDEYFTCEGHINIYHGNCDTKIPNLPWEEKT